MTGSASEFTEEAGRCITICFTYYSINNYYNRGGEFEGGSGAGIGLHGRGSADFLDTSTVVVLYSVY